VILLFASKSAKMRKIDCACLVKFALLVTFITDHNNYQLLLRAHFGFSWSQNRITVHIPKVCYSKEI